MGSRRSQNRPSYSWRLSSPQGASAHRQRNALVGFDHLTSRHAFDCSMIWEAETARGVRSAGGQAGRGLTEVHVVALEKVKAIKKRTGNSNSTWRCRTSIMDEGRGSQHILDWPPVRLRCRVSHFHLRHIAP